jgi:hypothetical protein
VDNRYWPGSSAHLLAVHRLPTSIISSVSHWDHPARFRDAGSAKSRLVAAYMVFYSLGSGTGALAATRAYATILHLHYLERPYLDQFKDFKALVIQYSVKTSGIPISEVRKRYSQTIAGGVDEIDYEKLSVAEMREQWTEQGPRPEPDTSPHQAAPFRIVRLQRNSSAFPAHSEYRRRRHSAYPQSYSMRRHTIGSASAAQRAGNLLSCTARIRLDISKKQKGDTPFEIPPCASDFRRSGSATSSQLTATVGLLGMRAFQLAFAMLVHNLNRCKRLLGSTSKHSVACMLRELRCQFSRWPPLLSSSGRSLFR